MTYEELKARLTKCEIKLEEFKAKNSPARKSKNYNTVVEKLTLLKESLQAQLNEMDSDKVILTTKKGKSYVAGMDKQSARDLFRGEDDIEVSDEEGNELNEDGVKFTKEETAAIAREVGKAVAKALHTSGDEVAHMKAKDIEPNSFEIYVQYKNDSDDQFSFYITDDTLHLVDFSFDKEIGDVGVKPSGEAIVHVDVLANELVKHFKSLAAEGMSDQEWADAKEADRLEKHPEKDTIKKIQALIAAQQKDESIFDTPRMGGFHNSKGVAGHMNTYSQDKAYADSNRKAREKDDETIDEAPEDKSYIKVAVRDARKALNIIDDSPAYSKAVEIDGSDTYYLDDKELAYDLLMDLGAQGIEVTDNNIEDDDLDDYGRSHSGKDSHTRYSDEEFADMTDPLKRYARFNENESEDEGGDLDIGHQDDEPDMLKQYAYDIATYAAKLYKQLDKYDQMDAEVDFPNWWQSKVILAKDYISKAQHYLEFEEKQPAIDQLALEESVNESHAKLKREYDELVGKMKQLAKHFKTAEGEKKAKIVAALKQHTARKRELENLIDQSVSGMGAGQELDGNVDELFGSKLNYDEIIGGIVKRFHELKKYVGKKEPDAMDDLEKVLRAFEIFDEKMAYGTHMELEQVSEAKATCCGKCGRVHVKGTKCKRPYLTGKDHCRYN